MRRPALDEGFPCTRSVGHSAPDEDAVACKPATQLALGKRGIAIANMAPLFAGNGRRRGLCERLRNVVCAVASVHSPSRRGAAHLSAVGRHSASGASSQASSSPRGPPYLPRPGTSRCETFGDIPIRRRLGKGTLRSTGTDNLPPRTPDEPLAGRQCRRAPEASEKKAAKARRPMVTPCVLASGTRFSVLFFSPRPDNGIPHFCRQEPITETPYKGNRVPNRGARRISRWQKLPAAACVSSIWLAACGRGAAVAR